MCAKHCTLFSVTSCTVHQTNASARHLKSHSRLFYSQSNTQLHAVITGYIRHTTN